MPDAHEIAKIFEKSRPINREKKIASVASLAYHGVLQEVSRLSLCSSMYDEAFQNTHFEPLDLGFVPGDQLKALVPCVSDYIEIINVTGYNVTRLLDSVCCSRLKVTQKLNQEETNALVRAMSTRVDEVYLGGDGGHSLDVDTLTQYKGDGKCSVICCNLPNEWIGVERTERWARMMNWSAEKDTMTLRFARWN